MQPNMETFSFSRFDAQPIPWRTSAMEGPDALLRFQYPIVINSEEELDYFLGDVVSGIGKAAGNITKAIDRVVPVSKVAKGIGDVVSAVDKVVPVSLLVPGGVLMRFAGDTVSRIARGQNVFKALEQAGTAAVGDVRKGLQLASTVASFVPGIGTGVAAALGAANALANGEPITDAVIAAARSAIPGGQIAQAAFDMATNLAKGKNIGEALLDTARKRLPGGPLVQAAYDAGLAIAKGQSLQQAVLKATGRVLPKSPFAENALSFVNKAMAGQNIQTAALSKLGNSAYRRMKQFMPDHPVYHAALKTTQSPRPTPRPAFVPSLAPARGRPYVAPATAPRVAPVPRGYPIYPMFSMPKQVPTWSTPKPPEIAGILPASGRWLRRDGEVIVCDAYEAQPANRVQMW